MAVLGYWSKGAKVLRAKILLITYSLFIKIDRFYYLNELVRATLVPSLALYACKLQCEATHTVVSSITGVIIP